MNERKYSLWWRTRRHGYTSYPISVPPQPTPAVMTIAAYRETGGVLGALTRRTEETYAGLSSSEQALARQVFLRLVTLGEGVEDTRRRARLSELSSIASDESTDESTNESTLERVLVVFGRYRLLTFDWDERTGEATVEVAHEAMLRAWPRLREWLEESREDLRVQRRLMQEASDWAQAGRDTGLLTTGTRLAQFEGLAEAGDVALTTVEREYLAASVEERDRQEEAERERQTRELRLQKRAASRLRVLVTALAVFLAVALALSGFAVDKSQAVEANLSRSEAQRLAAQAIALIQRGQFPETATLLSLRSMNTLYTPEGDAALLQAATLQFPVKQFEHPQEDGGLSAAFSPDGRYLVTSGNMGDVAYLWDVSSSDLDPIGEFKGHTQELNGIVFSPDGMQILTTGQPDDNTARLWDVLTATQVLTITHPGIIIKAIFSADGKYIVTAGNDGIARLWDARTGEMMREYKGHTWPQPQSLCTGGYPSAMSSNNPKPKDTTWREVLSSTSW